MPRQQNSRKSELIADFGWRGLATRAMRLLPNSRKPALIEAKRPPSIADFVAEHAQ
jgi:hypothetical protein